MKKPNFTLNKEIINETKQPWCDYQTGQEFLKNYNTLS